MATITLDDGFILDLPIFIPVIEEPETREQRLLTLPDDNLGKLLAIFSEMDLMEDAADGYNMPEETEFGTIGKVRELKDLTEEAIRLGVTHVAIDITKDRKSRV